MNAWRYALLSLIYLFSVTSLWADPLQCRFTDGPIKLDGRPSETAWTKGPALSEVGWVWNRSHLYFAVKLPEQPQPLTVLWLRPAFEGAGTWRIDVNALGGAKLHYLEEGVTEVTIPEGLEIEAISSNRAAASEETLHGNWLEGRIPWLLFSSTGGRAIDREQWQFAISSSARAEDVQVPDRESFQPLVFHSSEDLSARPLGIAERIPLTTSRVVGRPDVAPPFRVARVLNKLQVNWPVFAITEPGSRRLLFIDQPPGPYTLTRLCRTGDDPAAGDYSVLLERKELEFSVCFHPRFAENGYMFIGSNGGTPKKSRVTRVTLKREPPYDVVPDSERLIIDWPSDGHNGAAIAFGLDGMLYITSGDGTSDSDTDLMGQGLDHLLSKVLRIDVDHVSGAEMYSVPSDNPFVNMPGVRPETWAYGFRNPWRMSVDEKTGAVWVGNNGQDLWEQIFRVERGANYGWSVYEGSHPFYLNRQLGPHPHTPPTFEHPHSEARSLTGGIVYYGKRLPELYGAYLYGDYSTGKIWGAKYVDGQLQWHRELADTTLQITAFASDADGELLIADHHENAGFYTLETNDQAYDPAAFPRRLSETGLFQSVKDHVVQPGLIPYSVNSPLWSDGAEKTRFIAIPESAGKDGAMPKIQFTLRGPWVLPDSTVLVKSFSLDMRDGDPSSRRFIETRLLTKQEGEWVGYSYVWNNAQDEATLVEAAGLDVTYEIETEAGIRQQTWHYPSRTECMVCHSRAANFVLGVSTMQMNRDHDYNGVIDNQLRVFEHLGLLEFDPVGGPLEELQSVWNKAAIPEETRTTWIAHIKKSSDKQQSRNKNLLWKQLEEFETLPDPYDASSASVELRARSYLHANCAQCHVAAGGGNAQIDLEYHTDRLSMRLKDEKPLHHTFGIADARLIAPGDPDRSVLLERVARRGEGQMPQLATSVVDERAVALLREWILSFKE